MNLNTRIQNLSGVVYDATRTLGFWGEAARDTISLIITYSPLLLERIVRRVNIPITGLLVGAESAVFFNVARDNFPCKKVAEGQISFYNIPYSVLEHSNVFPIYYIDNSNSSSNRRVLKILPAPLTDTDSQVDYIDYYTIDNTDLATDGSGKILTSITTQTPVAGSQYQFDSIAHGLLAGDIVSLSSFDITDLNGITAVVDDTNLTVDLFELKGIVSPDTTAATTGVVSRNGVKTLPTEFIHAMCLKTAMYELHWELTEMKASLPNTTGSTDWAKVKTFIESEEDVELAAAKIQELSGEIQQWLIHYRWVESQYYTLEKEFKTLLLPMASNDKERAKQETSKKPEER